MAHLTQHDCNRIVTQLNTRPRKRLGYRTPEECYDDAHCCTSKLISSGKAVDAGTRMPTERNVRLEPSTHSSTVALPFRAERVGQHSLLHANEADIHQNWEGGGRQQSGQRSEQKRHTCEH